MLRMRIEVVMPKASDRRRAHHSALLANWQGHAPGALAKTVQPAGKRYAARPLADTPCVISLYLLKLTLAGLGQKQAIR